MMLKAEFSSECYNTLEISSSVTEEEMAKIIDVFNEYKSEGYKYNVSEDTLYLYGPDTWDDPGEPVFETQKLRHSHTDYTSKFYNRYGL